MILTAEKKNPIIEIIRYIEDRIETLFNRATSKCSNLEKSRRQIEIAKNKISNIVRRKID